MDKKSYDLEKLFYFPEKVEYKPAKSSFRESLIRILEALYIQKIKESNSDYLSQLSFNEILNLPSLVSESIFNALISEPREFIKLEEFVEGLSFLFDKNIDFEYNDKTNVPRIYEILYKIFCLKKSKQKSFNDINKNKAESKSQLSSVLSNENHSGNDKNNLSAYTFNYQFDLESFNKLISNILLVLYINANHFKTEEFLPFCEEIKLIVKKTFNFNSQKNLILNNNFSYNSNINLNITSNCNNGFQHFNQNNINLGSLAEKEEEFSCRSFNINLNLNNNANCDTSMNLNMNMQNNVRMNLNLNMNINNISSISDNLNKTNVQCSQCKQCMECSKLNSVNNINSNLNNNEFNNTQKNFISIEDFIECLQKNSKLLFILLFLFHSLSPINQKLIYLLMKNPASKIIEDEGEGDFIEEDEKAEEIQSIPDSVKKVNLEEIKSNSRIMSENNSINDSFEGHSNFNVNNNNSEKLGLEKKGSLRSVDSNNSKISNSNFLAGKNNNYKDNEEKDFQENYNAKNFSDKVIFNNKESEKIKQSESKAKIVFDFSEDTDSFSHLNSNLNANKNGSLNNTNSQMNSESINNYNASKTNSCNGSSGTLNNFENKSKFFNTKSLFERNNFNANNFNDSNNHIIYSVKPEEIEENVEGEKTLVTDNNSTLKHNNLFYKVKQGDSEIKRAMSIESHKNSLFSGNSDPNSNNQKSKFFTSTNNNLNDYLSNEKINNKENENFNNRKNSNFNGNNDKDKNIQVKKNVINFNLDDDSSSFINNNRSSDNSIQNKHNMSDANARNKLNFYNNTNTQRSDNNNIKIISYNVKNENTDSHIIVYRQDKTNESSEYTDNNIIFDSKFRKSFDNIIISNRDETNSNINNTNNKNMLSDLSRSNTKNSLYNEFNEFLNDKNNKNAKSGVNNLNQALNQNNESRSLSSKFRVWNAHEGISQIKSHKTFHENRNVTTINSLLNQNDNPLNEQFAFEEVFSELKVSVQKVKISKDFIFDANKCEKFAYHSKHNKNFSFKNFNFNVENDWVIRSLKDIYLKINERRISEIKNINKHLSFITVFYQFNSVDKAANKKAVKTINANNTRNSNENEDYLKKEKSKNLTKSIADIIDEYLVVFTFKNSFEADLIHNYISSNKEKLKERLNRKEKEFKLGLGSNFNDFDKDLAGKNKNVENPIFNPTNKKSSNKTNNQYPNSNKETIFGFSDKTTNYKYTTNKIDSKESINLRNFNNINDLENKQMQNNFQYKENIEFVNHSEEANSEVLSVMDIYESNDFFSVNLKLIVNLRNSEVIPLQLQMTAESQFYPLKIKQEENLHFFFFETELERDILLNYYQDKIKNINPIKNYDSLDLISKSKSLEFTKGAHKTTKDLVEIKKYFKKNLKSEKIIKEINSLRDLSMVYKFFEESKIPKILFFENTEEIYFVYENYENDPIKFIFMNPDLKVTKDISKYSLNIKKMKELKNMLEILSISLSPDVNGDN